MLQQLRDRTQTFKPLLWAIIFSFLISFVFIFQGGAGSVSMFGGGRNDAARVSGRAISEAEFRSALIRQEENLKQILGAQYDPDRFLNPRSVLDALIDRAILLEEAERVGVEPARREVAAYIKEISAFHDEAGRFDKSRYEQYLRNVRMRAPDFEQQVADDLAMSAMNRLLATGAAIPTAAVREAWRRENEVASTEHVIVGLEPHLASVDATDDELRAHYEAHQDDYDAGPAREIRWVRFARDDFQRGLENEEEMRAYHQEHLETIYTMTEDQRRASIVLVALPPGATDEEKAATRARAEGVAARARVGEDFAALAAELSDDPATREKGGDLGPFFQGVQEPAVDAAVFAAAEGDVLGPIETMRGFEVVRVTKGSGAKARSFDEVRDLVARGLYAGKAAEAQATALAKFQDTLKAKKGFEDAAKAAGVAISGPEWLTVGGSLEALGPNPMIGMQAFDLGVDAISEPISDIGGQVIIQVTGERETSPQSFEDARPSAEEAVKERKARDLARADAEAFHAAASSAASLADAAGERIVETVAEVRRSRSVPGIGLAPDYVAVAFETPVGAVGRPADVPSGIAVLRVTHRTEIDEATFEADREALARRLHDQQAASLRGGALDRLRETYKGKIKINDAMLRAYSATEQRGG